MPGDQGAIPLITQLRPGASFLGTWYDFPNRTAPPFLLFWYPVLPPLQSAVKSLGQQGLVSFLFKRLQGERSRENLPVISKAREGVSQVGKWVTSMEQEEGGHPEQAGRTQWG